MKSRILVGVWLVAMALNGAVVHRWQAETSEIAEEEITAYHGESVELQCKMTSYGQVIPSCKGGAWFMWQTNGMNNAWWVTNAVFGSGQVKANFTPFMDTGADKYRFFFKVSDAKGANYRANGTISLLGSPAGDARYLPLPAKIIDFSQVDVRHPEDAPFAMKGADAAKRDKDDYRVYRKMKDCWTWKNWRNPQEPSAREAPADFLALANSPGSEPIFFSNGAWWGAVQFWPNGKVKYSQSNIPPAGTGEFSTRLNFAMFAYDETGTNEIFRFGATATRTDPTNETLISWSDSANQFVRIATTDMVHREIEASRVEGAARTLPKYLHYFEFDSTYPDDAEWYCDRIDGIGYCSSVRRGNEYARNYDWLYDESVTGVVKIPAADGRFASVGVASVGTNLTEEIVTSGRWSRFYKCLPGMMLDGINENGVVANINVVAKNGSAWETQGERTLNILRSVRWILDTAASASNAAEYVAANAYVPPSIQKLGYSIHLMVADKDETWVVEDGVASNITARAAQVMTNFRLLSDDDPYGSGYERYDILTNAANSITNAWYTNAYKPNAQGVYPWPTEFAAHGVGTHDETEALQRWAQENVTPNLPPKRNGRWWQTVHCSVYDLAHRTLHVAVQEQDDWYTFAVQSAGGVKPEAVKEIVSPMIGSATNGLRRVEDMAVYEVVRTENTNWTWTSEDSKELEGFLNSYGVKPVWEEELTQVSKWVADKMAGGWSWVVPTSPPYDEQRRDDCEVGLRFEKYVEATGDYVFGEATARRPRYMDETHVPSTNAVLAAVVTNGAGAVATGDLMKVGADGRLVKAEAGTDYLKEHQDISGKLDNNSPDENHSIKWNSYDRSRLTLDGFFECYGIDGEKASFFDYVIVGGNNPEATMITADGIRCQRMSESEIEEVSIWDIKDKADRFDGVTFDFSGADKQKAIFDNLTNVIRRLGGTVTGGL